MKIQQIKLLETAKRANHKKVLTFDEGVTIQCGASSITLTPEGDVIINARRIIQDVQEDVLITANKLRLNRENKEV